MLSLLRVVRDTDYQLDLLQFLGVYTHLWPSILNRLTTMLVKHETSKCYAICPVGASILSPPGRH